MLNIKDKTLPSLINLLLVLAMFLSINTYADLKNSPFDVVLPPDKKLKLPSREEFSGVYLNKSLLDSEFDFEFGFNEQKDEQERLIGFDDNEESLSLDANPILS